MKDRSAQLLNLLQTIAIIAGIAFGAVEIIQFRQERHRQAEIELAHSFMTPEFTDALAVLFRMPDSVTTEVIETTYSNELGKVFLVNQTFETVGILVHQGDLDLSLVDDFLGTMIIASWRQLRPWVTEYREAHAAASVAEWFQWLAERLEEYRSTEAPLPAYDAFRNWKRP